MKKTWFIPMVLGTAALLLSACTRSDSSTSTAEAGAAATDTTGVGTAISLSTAVGDDPVITLAGGMGTEQVKLIVKETEAQTADTQAVQQVSDSTDSGVTVQTETQAADSVTITDNTQTETDAPAPADTDAAGTDTAGDNTGAGTVVPLTEASQQDEDDQQETSAVASSTWVGTFTQSSGETLTVYSADSSGISFGFAVSGISGYASIDGGSAVYSGDDNHNVIFEIAGDMIYVTVTNLDGYDTAEAGMIGNYVRQQ